MSSAPMSFDAFEAVFQLSPDPLVVSRATDGLIVAVNQAFTTLFGYPRDEAIGKTATELGFWPSDDARERLLADARSGLGTRLIEATVRRKDGSTIDVRATLSTFSLNGETWNVSITRDVSERRAAERALKASEAQYRLLAERSTDVIARIALDGSRLYTSPSVERVQGWTAEELLGHSPFEIFHPDDAPRLRESMQRMIASGEPETNVYRSRRKDGSWMWSETTATPIRDEHGRVVEFHTSTRNVTAREQALDALRQREAQLRVLLDHATEAIVIVDVGARRFLEANPAATRLLQRSRAELLALAPWSIEPGAPPSERLSFDPDGIQVARAVSGELPVYECKLTDPDGSVRLCEVRLVSLPSLDRVLVRGSIIDISERVRAREALAELNRTLERRVAARTHELTTAMKELETFSYSVSHDLRAPLRAIDGFSLALLEDHAGALDGDGRALLERVRGAATRMGALIDDLLALTRTSRKELRRARVDVTAVALDVLDGLARADLAHRPEVQVEPGLAVDADPVLLRSVLENLLGNAWKYTSRTPSARIEVAGFVREGVAGFVVRDNGAGFDMAQAHRLFAPFQRLHRASEFEGHGIGLATVQRIVQRHGGTVRAHGEVGRGASFEVTLGVDPELSRRAG